MNITGYEHVGTRVSDRETALGFYESLGFRIELEDDSDAIELINENGVRINLIVNAIPAHDGKNVLMDNPAKIPGHTHAAFVVASLDHALAHVEKHGYKITEGPKTAERRRYFFIRDPDGNVLEFNEMLD